MSLSAEFHSRRRRELMDRLGAGAAVLVPAASERLRSNDVEYRFRQNSDFDYLTGFPEPDALCLLLPGHPKHEFVLFVRPRDPERETWTGRRVGVDGAMGMYGADAAHPLDEIAELVPRMLEECERLFYAVDHRGEYDRKVLGWMEALQTGRQRSGVGPTALADVRPVLHEMRIIKEAEEVAALRSAAQVSCTAHERAMALTRAGQYEYQVEAEIEYSFRSQGAAGPAYPSIVATGGNATTLHYTENCCELDAHDLLLIDAGAEVDLYCGDVTRTFPVGERFDGRQRAIYEVVLAAQEAAILAVRPGACLDELHQIALGILVRGLIDVGILAGKVDDCIAQELHRPYFMHRTSHWLGKDVHDVGLYRLDGASRALEPGMVLTVEPGLYLSEQSGAPPQWQGIGVRIEDDVLVTEAGFEVLTEQAPKDIEDIEALRREA
jgi:Xaa-Pro aminopeptidase